MQVQYSYHPSMGPHLLYHYAVPSSSAAPAHSFGSPISTPPAAPPPPPPPPPPPAHHHPYFAFPMILQHQQPHQPQQQQPPQQRPHPAAAAAAAAAFFAQQQQLASLALHFQALSVVSNGVVGNGVVSCGSGNGSGSGSSVRSGSSGSGSPFDADRARSYSFGKQPLDYHGKLLAWLKTHRMHKYYDRLRKYSFDQLLALERDTLEAEQFTQGAIKKLLGMLERVRQDRAAFDSPTRSPGAASSPPGHVTTTPAVVNACRVLVPSQQLPVPAHMDGQQQHQPPLIFPPPPPPPPSHHLPQHLQTFPFHQHPQHQNQQQQRYLCIRQH